MGAASGGERRVQFDSHKDADLEVSQGAASVARSAESSEAVKVPPADAERDWGYTRAFLVGLGLWSLSDGAL